MKCLSRLLAGAAAFCVLSISAPLGAQSPTLLRLRNAASVDRLTADSSGTVLMQGTFGSGAVQSPGAGSMLLWYPRKSAFRAGWINGTQWNDANVGTYSVAMGSSTTAGGNYSTALGAGSNASGNYSLAAGQLAVASGYASTALGYQPTASGLYSFATGYGAVAGGVASTALGQNTAAAGNFGFAAGNGTSASGSASVAMGSLVTAAPGSFAFGDLSTGVVTSSGVSNEFLVRAAGGVKFYSNGGLFAGVALAPGAGSWSTLSDRHRKEQFLPVRGEDVLARVAALPITTWRYIAEVDRTVRHIGPMAQDWRVAFGFGPDSTTINTGDLDGVNLAGVQALTTRTNALRAADAAHDARIAALEARNAELTAMLAAVQAQNERLEARLNTLERGVAPPARP